MIFNLNLTKFRCGQCQQAFTKQDKENENWTLDWDTTEPEIRDYGKEGFVLSLWVRSIEHQKCSPEEGVNYA